MPKELELVYQLFNEGEEEKALDVLDEFTREKNLIPEEELASLSVRCSLYLTLSKFKESYELAEKLFDKSQNLGYPLFSIDAISCKIHASILLPSLQGTFKKYQELIDQADQILKSNPEEPIDEINFREAIIASCKAFVYYNKGYFDLAIKFYKIALVVAEIDIRFSGYKLTIYSGLGAIYFAQGKLETASEFCQKAILLDKSRSYTSKVMIAYSYQYLGRISILKGDFNLALDYLKRSLMILEEAQDVIWIGQVFDCLIRVSLATNSLEQVNKYLDQFYQLNEKNKIRQNLFIYKLSKARIMKHSQRIRDWVEAEALLKRCIEGRVGYSTIMGLIELCDLQINELKMTNNSEILEEIQSSISQLVRHSRRQNSFSLLSETMLLQAKLALIQLQMDEAKKLLTQSQNIAYEHGFEFLAQRISSEYDKLLEQSDKWENLNKTNAPISERIELASIDGVMDRIQEKRALEPPKLETEEPVSLAIFSKTGYIVFSKPFTEEQIFNEKILGNFISMSKQMFSESLDRMKFGEFTVLLDIIDTFSIGYVFRGQSYSAQQRLNNFSEAIKENKRLLDTLNTAVRTGQTLIIDENSDLKELIANSFLADPVKFQLPFEAYKGDEPFLFVSYAHSDKLQVYPIMDYLNKSGFNIWYDEGISVSDDWKKSIVENIDKCRAFLVFITPHIIDSKYVRREISYALDINKPFYSVYLKDTQLPHELKFEISGIQSMKKYTMPDEEFYTKLKEVLSPVLSGKN